MGSDISSERRATVEHTLNRPAGARAVATRYEKRALISPGAAALAALAPRLRT
ncbi:hypothetical protein [Streptomyces pratensis]|uniref:hypothetical protein n=1 Tax=Streptomyces pratensis TaxID=1169025 RepID=UPI003015BA13